MDGLKFTAEFSKQQQHDCWTYLLFFPPRKIKCNSVLNYSKNSNIDCLSKCFSWKMFFFHRCVVVAVILQLWLQLKELLFKVKISETFTLKQQGKYIDFMTENTRNLSEISIFTCSRWGWTERCHDRGGLITAGETFSSSSDYTIPDLILEI